MATSIDFKRLLVGIAVLLVIVGFSVMSCDRRGSIDTTGNDQGGGTGGIDNVLVRLSPTQIFLPSPEATATDTIVITLMDAEGIGISGAYPRVTRTPSNGSITQPDSTDRNGQTRAVFQAQPGQYGTVVITVTAGTKTKSTNLYISGPSEYTLNLTYSPPVPKLIDHEAVPYVITASLVDTTQRGVAGQPVIFSVLNQVGRIGFSDPNITVPFTNPQGIATVNFFNTEFDEVNNPTQAIIQVVTSSPTDSSNPIVASVTLPLRRVRNALTLEANPNTIFGDGTSTSQVRAILLDTDGHGIIHDTISFRNIDFDGSIQASQITDSNGIAVSTFTPFSNHINSTRIIAEYKLGSIHQAIDTTEISILPVRAIGYITVSLQKPNVTADGVDSSLIFITVQDSLGGLIADGTELLLSHIGLGRLTPTIVHTIGGQANASISGPTSIDLGPKSDTILVSGHLNDTTTVTGKAVVNYVPGKIATLEFIEPLTAVTLVAGSGESVVIRVIGKDANGNNVANGTQITFRNNIQESTLNPESASTDSGVATTTYLIGSMTGVDNVVGWILNPNQPTDTIFTLQPVVINCISSTATTLVLSASQPNIQVGGASCQIIATLQDAYGNPLSEGYDVAFQIVSSPGGTPTQKPSFDTQPGIYYDSVLTNIAGQAIVQLYSGTAAGAVSIRACTVPDSTDTLPLFACDQKSLVTISSGPPAHVSISFTYSGQATNQNTPERFTQSAAIVWDQYTNPVEYGTAVYFSLIPATTGEIEGNSFTGGPRPYHPDSVNGVAYTRIIYGCFSTFDTVRVVASSAGEFGPVVDTSEALSLPIFDGTITLIANPGNLWTDNSNCTGPGSRDTSNITAYLIDGGGCPIKNGIISFSAIGAGAIIGQSIDTTDVQGRAFTSFMVRGCEIQQQQDGTCRITTTVKATLLQDNEVVGTIDIVCSRDCATQ